MIFLHGWGANLQAFLFVAKVLDCHSVLVDFYGFGKTPHPDYPLTVSDYAKGVIDVMKKEGIKSAVIVGHSFGGRVAIEIAAKHPELVEKLVLVDSGIKQEEVKYYLKLMFTTDKIGVEDVGQRDLSRAFARYGNKIKSGNYDQKGLYKILNGNGYLLGTTIPQRRLYMARIKTQN